MIASMSHKGRYFLFVQLHLICLAHNWHSIMLLNEVIAFADLSAQIRADPNVPLQISTQNNSQSCIAWKHFENSTISLLIYFYIKVNET